MRRTGAAVRLRVYWRLFAATVFLVAAGGVVGISTALEGFEVHEVLDVGEDFFGTVGGEGLELGASGLIAIEFDLLEIGVADIGGVKMGVAVLAGIFLVEQKFGTVFADVFLEFFEALALAEHLGNLAEPPFEPAALRPIIEGEMLLDQLHASNVGGFLKFEIRNSKSDSLRI